jgi:NAD(P)H dehydrogenase (quinone)
MKEILVLYYSQNGSTKELAKIIARGINSIEGVNAKLKTVPSSNSLQEEYLKIDEDEYVTLSDLEKCDALALGSPVHFGTMASSLKYFLESTSSQWLTGALVGKPACVFTSSSSLHGGQESCLLSMILPLLHHGMLILGIPYTNTQLLTTTSGGTPYGVTHFESPVGNVKLTKEERELAFNQGVRIANVCKFLNHKG